MKEPCGITRGGQSRAARQRLREVAPAELDGSLESSDSAWAETVDVRKLRRSRSQRCREATAVLEHLCGEPESSADPRSTCENDCQYLYVGQAHWPSAEQALAGSLAGGSVERGHYLVWMIMVFPT